MKIQSGLQAQDTKIKRTHSTPCPQAHTSTPKLKRGEEPALQDTTATHKYYSHARWTLQYSTNGRENTGHRLGEEMRQHNRQGKKAFIFFSTQRQMNTGVNRVMQANLNKYNRKEGKWWRSGRKRNIKNKLSGIKMRRQIGHVCEIHYCLRCTALFLISQMNPIKSSPFFNHSTPLFSITISLWI